MESLNIAKQENANLKKIQAKIQNWESSSNPLAKLDDYQKDLINDITQMMTADNKKVSARVCLNSNNNKVTTNSPHRQSLAKFHLILHLLLLD